MGHRDSPLFRPYPYQNFYEGILPPEAVTDGAEAVRDFTDKLRRLI